MKKYTLFNSDNSVSFETDFIPTACAFTSHEPSAHGGKQLRSYINEGIVVKAISESGRFDFDNGQYLVKN